MNNADSLVYADNRESIPFENLLQRLDPNRDLAGQKYETLRRKLIKFFEREFRLSADDLVDETLDRVGQTLTSRQVPDVSAFAWGVARNVRREACKRGRRILHTLDLRDTESFLTDTKDMESEIHERIERQRRSKYFHACISLLAEQDRRLFLAYHNTDGEDTRYRQRLATSLGLTIGALRTRVNRVRDELEQYARRYPPTGLSNSIARDAEQEQFG